MLPARSELADHEVTNQPPPRGDVDLWADDPALAGMVRAMAGDAGHIAAHGAALGREELRAAGREAMRVLPEPRLFDAGGRRLDEVVFHPAYHRLMAEGLGAGYAALAWDGAAGGHVSHAALVYLHNQVEPGTCCPMTMTYAAVPALAADPALAAEWRPKLLSRVYDPAVAPLAEKRGATLGMAMTEKQGGSDVRANATRAVPDGSAYRLYRPQVVLLGADVGRVPHARPGAGRPDLLSGAALAGGRAQRHRAAAAEGQAGQPRQCLVGDRVSRRAGASPRRRGAGGAHDHRDGASYPARHRGGAGRADARGAGRGASLGQPIAAPSSAG